MNNENYYTDQEAQQQLMKLVFEGKGLTALKDDPRCPPDMKVKLQNLEDLHKSILLNENLTLS